jgi:hypothetical protein
VEWVGVTPAPPPPPTYPFPVRRPQTESCITYSEVQVYVDRV